MLTIDDILAKAEQLTLELQENSITPPRVGELLTSITEQLRLLSSGGTLIGASKLSELSDVMLLNEKQYDVLQKIGTKWTNVAMDLSHINQLLTWFKKDAFGDIYTDENFYSTKEISANELSTDSLEIGGFTTGPLGSGGGFKMIDGISNLEVDKLVVRKLATFFELAISKLSHVGGQIILSPARMTCIKVMHPLDESYYRCYFDTGQEADGNGGWKALPAQTVFNEFVVDDLARCQTFDGTGNAMRYYWRRVIACGHDYIDLSGTDCEAGSMKPQAGDDIVQLGHKYTASRQNAQILSTVGADAPSYKQYRGINSYALTPAMERTKFTSQGNTVVGTLKVTNGGVDTDIKDYVDNIQVGGRNLVLNSSNFNDLSNWNVLGEPVPNASIVTEESNKCIKLSVTGTQAAYTLVVQTLLSELEKNTDYTISFRYKSIKRGVMVYVYSATTTNIMNWEFPANIAFERKEIKFNTGSGDKIKQFRFDCYEHTSGISELYIYDIKLEKGNKATDWTPAPEDVEAAIFETKLYVQYSSVDPPVSELDWHEPPMEANDIYFRQKLGNNPWGAAVKFVGANGTSISMKGSVATYDPDLLAITGMMIGDGRITRDTGKLWVYDGTDWVDAGVIKGTDALPLYLHTAYANSADGSVGFSTTDPVGKEYIGMYSDNAVADKEDYIWYTWMKIKGEKGDSAPLLYLSASSQVMKCNRDGSAIAGQTITISAKTQNAPGTATYEAIPYINGVPQTAITLGGSGNARTLTSDDWINPEWEKVVITATLSVNTITLTDVETVWRIMDGKPATNSASVSLYKRTETATVPARPTQIATYRFSDGLLTNIDNGWTKSLPTTGGAYRWVTMASVISEAETDTIDPSEWTTPEILAEDGLDGEHAIVYELVSSSYVANRNAITGAYTPAVINLSGLKTIGNGTPAAFGGIYKIYRNGTLVYTSITSEILYNYTIPADTTSIKVELYLGAVKVDETTIAITNDGTGGLSCSLSNEAHSVPCDAAEAPLSYTGSGTDIYVSENGNNLSYVTGTPVAGQFSVTASASGITCGAITAGTNPYRAIVGAHQGMTANPAQITYTITACNSKGVTTTIKKVQTLTKSIAGASGYNVANVIVYRRSATALTNSDRPTAQSTYTFSTASITGLNNGWTLTIPSGTDPLYAISAPAVSKTDTDTIDTANWSTPVLYNKNGENPIVGQLTNEHIGFTTGSDGVVPAGSYAAASGTFLVIDGLTQVPAGSIQFSVASSAYCAVTINSSGTYVVGSMQSDKDYATATLQAIYKGITITKILTLSKSKQGIQGDPGTRPVVDVEYARSTSSTVAPTTVGVNGTTVAWQTATPAWVNGEYIWSRVKTTYGAETPTYSNPACITGNKGLEIKNITEQYYLSSADDDTYDGSWLNYMPTWQEGWYIWTRSMITWADNSTTYTDAAYSKIWETINNLEVGGVNLIKNGNFLARKNNWNTVLVRSMPALSGTHSGAASITVTSVNGIWQDFTSAGKQLTLYYNYTLTFKARRIWGSGLLTYGREKPGTTPTVALTTGWQTYTQTFYNDEARNIVFYHDIGQFEIADVKLVRSDNAYYNYIRNGNFTDGRNEWINGALEQNATTIAQTAAGNLPAGVVSGGRISTKIEAYGIVQDFTTKRMENGRYMLSFMARSVSGNASLTARYRDYIGVFALTGSWVKCQKEIWVFDYADIAFILGGIGVFDITNIQLEKGNKVTAFKSGYLETAIEQDTFMNGGLILSSVIGARDNGVVRSYMSGLEENPTAFAAGVENFGTETETKKTDLRHDGSGHLAGGNINWDADGNTEIKGDITAKDSATGAKTVIDASGMSIFNPTSIFPNIKIGLKNGYAVLEYYDNNGKFLYDLGPNGITYIPVVEEKWLAVDLVQLSPLGYQKILTDAAQKTKYKNAQSQPVFTAYQYVSKVVAGVKEDTANDGKVFRTSGDKTAENRITGYYCRKQAGSMVPITDTGNLIYPSGISTYNEAVYDRSNLYRTRLICYDGGVVVSEVYAYWNIP